MSTTKPAARGQRRGFYWQDWYAAWIMLRCAVSPAEGIIAVEPEAANAIHVDDIVVRRRHLVEYKQLKHTIHARGTLTGADLFASSDGSKPLITKLYNGWKRVRTTAARVEIQLVTNATKSKRRNNLLISPADLDNKILHPIQRGENIPVSLSSTIDEIGRLTEAPDDSTLTAFLRQLRLNFGEPNEEQLRGLVAQILRLHLRSDSIVEIEAESWAEKVYDLSTRAQEPGPLSRDRIERELRRIFGRNRVSEHKLALPENHVSRPGVASQILEEAQKIGEGYLLVKGPPGSGKTTLATWLADHYNDRIMLRYHVYDPRRGSAIERKNRASAFEFITTMFDALSARFPERTPMRVPSSERLADAISILGEELEQLCDNRTRLIIIDGIDHVVRSGISRDSLFDALPRPAPRGVLFILFGQPDWDYPRWLASANHLVIPPFSLQEARSHVLRHFDWGENSDHALVVANYLHKKSGGNPLSLFYNIALVEAKIGTNPEQVSCEMHDISLFGNHPHQEYERLLEDLELYIEGTRGSRSQAREVLTCISVAEVAISVERLVTAFSDEQMPKRVAQDLLYRLRPIVHSTNRGFLVFHDDFRRFIEERVDQTEIASAHSRIATALSKDWAPTELGALVEHYWLASEHKMLMHLPFTRKLSDWYALADPLSVVKMYRLSVASAFTLRDDVGVMRTTYAASRAAEALGEYAEHIEARDWSFIPPPRGISAESYRVRARALNAMAVQCKEDQKMASEIASRFLLKASDVSSDDPLLSTGKREYWHAVFRWKIKSGKIDEIRRALQGKNATSFSGWIGIEFTNETEVQILDEWTKAFAGISEDVDREIEYAAFLHFIEGRTKVAHIIASRLLDLESVALTVRRNALTITCLLAGETQHSDRALSAGVVWSLHGSLDPLGWRDLFCDGFMVTASRSKLDLSSCSFPEKHKTILSRSDTSNLQLGRFIWRAGCAAGLCVVNEMLIDFSDLRKLVGPYIGEGEYEIGVRRRTTFNECSRMILPFLAHSVANSSLIIVPLRQLMVEAGERAVFQVSEQTYGILEAVWILAPENWRELARVAFDVTCLPGSHQEDRVQWFRYWIDNANRRGITVPSRFEGLAYTARIGVHRKSDPAALPVKLLGSGFPVENASLHIRRTADLLHMLNKEQIDGDSARSQLPNLLALLFDQDPTEFEFEFNRSTALSGFAEAFGSLVCDTVISWLQAPGARGSSCELVTLFFWCTATLPHRDGVNNKWAQASNLIATRLSELGSHYDATVVRRWIASLATNMETKATRTEPEISLSEGLVENIDNINPRWFSSWWGDDGNRTLRRFLSTGDGGIAWSKVADLMAVYFASNLSIPEYEMLLVANGIASIRPNFPILEALKLALEHLSVKVQFQESLSPRRSRPTIPSCDRTEVVIRLIARGLEINDADTVRRSLRSLGQLAMRKDTSTHVAGVMMRLIAASNDIRTLTYALVILRCMEEIPGAVLSTLERFTSHPDAWCRWLACSILRRDPEWDAPREVSSGPVIMRGQSGATLSKLGRSFFSDAPAVTEVYLDRLSALFRIDTDVLQEWIETEAAALPDVPVRPSGWNPPRGHTFTNHRVGEAVGRLATRIASLLPISKVPILLSTIARFDPSIIVSEPVADYPNGWTEVCRAEFHYDVESYYLLRSLGILNPEARATGNLSAEEWGEFLCYNLEPSAPERYAWLAENWRADPPFLSSTAALPLSFHNSVFTELNCDRFELVPSYWLPMFRDLRFELRGGPRWIHPQLGTVLRGLYGEPDSYESPDERLSWWSAWVALPQWLYQEIGKSDAHLVQFWRKEVQQNQHGRSNESMVQYGSRLLHL